MLVVAQAARRCYSPAMNAESLLVSGLLVTMFGAGFAGGWYLAKDRASKTLTFTDWVSFGVSRKWVNRQATPNLFAAYVEHMAEKFDAIPRYDWPGKDRYIRSYPGQPE